MVTVEAAQLAPVIDFLKVERRGAEVSLPDVMRLAEAMAESLRPAVRALDEAICGELGDMAREIAAMKAELAELRLTDMRTVRIPGAGRELDAVVEATEAATNAIMSAAEAIMAADPSDPDGYQALVNDRVIEIFEACSFQDITGQRISKVVATLSLLDQRITTLVERLKLKPGEEEPERETAAERRRRDLILHGPQRSGEGVSQTDIDALLG